jgi:hypothetical protein
VKGKLMKFVKTQDIDATYNTLVVCISCLTKIKLNGAWADVEGEPFVAYYCDRCKEEEDIEEAMHEFCKRT